MQFKAEFQFLMVRLKGFAEGCCMLYVYGISIPYGAIKREIPAIALVPDR